MNEYCKNCIEFIEVKKDPEYRCAWTFTTVHPMGECPCAPSHYKESNVKQQQPSRCDHQKVCGKSKIGKHTDGKLYCYDEDCDDRIITFLTDASTVMLTEKLRQHYTALSAKTGKSVSELVARDLGEWHEHRRFVANTREKTHP